MISYLITDPLYYSNDVKIFEENLKKALTLKKVDMACFRDKSSENFKELAKVFVKICKEFNIEKILINGNYKLAKKLKATGVHLTSEQFNKIQKAKDLDLYTVISCHNYKDIENAQKQHVNAITYSPIFFSPNKPEAKGMAKLRETIRVYEDLDIIALGGIIDEEHISQISKTRAYGFASIRYFV
ncbi:thiamine phosphate synthase [Arcobacter sp. LA11]|uniref:thiamine phosphate synthase n=1 Tax=Arcobacter sp. LA11 TaxID=1898176 RepID=UPI0009339F88|nr:thiamine phosphate synthase [Arcobacter sp. LA11]